MPMDQIKTSGMKGNHSKAAGIITFDAIHSQASEKEAKDLKDINNDVIEPAKIQKDFV